MCTFRRFVGQAVPVMLSLAVASCKLHTVEPEPLAIPDQWYPADYQVQQTSLASTITVLQRDSVSIGRTQITSATLVSSQDCLRAHSQLQTDSLAYVYWNSVRTSGNYTSLKVPSSAQIISGLKYLRSRQDTILRLWIPNASLKAAAAQARQNQPLAAYYSHVVNNLTQEAGKVPTITGVINENISVLLKDSAFVIARQYSFTLSQLVTYHYNLSVDVLSLRRDAFSLALEGQKIQVPNYGPIPQFIWSEPGVDNINSGDVNEGAIPDPLKAYAGYDDSVTTTVNELYIGTGRNDSTTTADESGMYSVDQVIYYWMVDDNSSTTGRTGRLRRDDLAIAFWEGAKTDSAAKPGEKETAQGWVEVYTADRNLYYDFIGPFLEACKRVQTDDAQEETPETLLQMARNVVGEQLRIARAKLALVQIVLTAQVLSGENTGGVAGTKTGKPEIQHAPHPGVIGAQSAGVYSRGFVSMQ
jgi:hypothetical protein